MNRSKFFTFTILALLLLSGFAGLLTMPSLAVEPYDTHWDNIAEPGYLSSEMIGLETISERFKLIDMVGQTLYGMKNDSTFWKSIDYGDTWTIVSDPRAQGVEAGTVRSSHYSEVWGAFFVSIGSGVYASYNDGVTWSKVMTMAHNGYVYPGGWGESEDGMLYIGQYGSTNVGWGDTNYGYLNRSLDGGHTWSTLTKILCYHIHSVEVGHDGNIYAGYGDTGSGPNTSGLYQITTDGEGNISELYAFQPISIYRTATSTLLGSDSLLHASIIRYNGSYFEPVLVTPEAATGGSWYCADMIEVDGAIYATLSMSYLRNPHGNQIWSSIDDGRSWYCLSNDYQANTNAYPSLTGVTGSDGSPYLFVIYGDETVKRLSNLRDAGIRELMNGQRVAADVGETFSTDVYLANGEYEVPLSRNPIRDPTVKVYGYNLTNLVTDDVGDAYPSGFDSSAGLDVSKTSDDKSRGTSSVQINGTGMSAFQWTRYRLFPPSVSTTNNTYVIAFDAKKNGASADFTLESHIQLIGGTGTANGIHVNYYSLTDEWQTYSYQMGGANKEGSGSMYIYFSPRNWNNATCYVDNLRVFELPYAWNFDISPAVDWPYRASGPMPTASLTVDVDGSSHSYAGPYDHLELIDTIQLTGDYYDKIDLSAYGNGLTKFVITGERIGYAHNAVVEKTINGVDLLGGNDSSYYRSYDGWVYFDGVSSVNAGYTDTYRAVQTHPSLAQAMRVSTTGEAEISNVQLTSQSSRILSWDAGSDAGTELSCTVSGLTAGRSYLLAVDGTSVASGLTTDWNGALTFTYDVLAGDHTYKLNVAPVFLQDPITEWSYGTTYLYDPQTDEEWHGVTYSFTATGGMDWWIEPDSGILRCHITDTTPTDISMLADDGNGGLAWLNWTVTISSLPWDHEVIIGYEESQNYRVAFTFLVDNSQTANVERVQWNFGDGNGSRDASPVHTYDRPGKYVITCWVRLYDGTASATNMEITVGDPATVEDIDQRIAQQLNDAMLYVSLVAIIGLISMWAYARWAGSRGKFDKLVLALIGVAMLAISTIIIGGALQ